jgi:hypothetical protein
MIRAIEVIYLVPACYRKVHRLYCWMRQLDGVAGDDMWRKVGWT